jgi:hypothetical protein
VAAQLVASQMVLSSTELDGWLIGQLAKRRCLPVCMLVNLLAEDSTIMLHSSVMQFNIKRGVNFYFIYIYIRRF